VFWGRSSWSISGFGVEEGDEVDGAVDEYGHVEHVTQRHVDVVEHATVDTAEERYGLDL